MHLRPLLTRVAFACAVFLFPSFALAQNAQADLKALVEQIQAKIQAGKRSAADLAPDLAAFDKLVDKYKDKKDDDAAQIAYMRAALYLQVLEETEKGKAMLVQIKADYPGTKAAQAVDRLLETLERRVKAEAAKASLVGQPAPELNFKWSSRDGLKKLSDLRGKVVILDFWATWCGPCIASFPHIRELVDHYKDSEVVVLGVTSLQGMVVNLEPQPINTEGKPEKEYELIKTFMKAKDMTWPVAFSAEEVFNPDYGIEGIPHLAIIAPDGKVRHNGLHPATPHDEITGKIDAILKEFKLKVPTH